MHVNAIKLSKTDLRNLASSDKSTALYCHCLRQHNLQGHATPATTMLSMSECAAHAIFAIGPYLRAARLILCIPGHTAYECLSVPGGGLQQHLLLSCSAPSTSHGSAPDSCRVRL